MLTQEVIDTVKSTAPVLAQHGEQITRLFYQKLFNAHPELQNVFNMAHQAQGDQPKALADSVFQYASHIDRLAELGPLVSRIAHKHASLSVAPEHYPVVGHFLLEAVAEHLSLDSQDPIIQAWAVAYQQLAAIFVTTEEQIYQGNAEKTGGWRGFRAFIIDRITTEAEGVRSFYLRPEDGGPVAEFKPGQYIGLKTQTRSGEYDEIRQYSLSDAPGKPYYRITVKSESNDPSHPGRVSHRLHEAQVGERVFVQPPTGDFTLDEHSEQIVLIAGGVGITPLLSMLLHRLESRDSGAGITLIQCCRDATHHIMKDELTALSQRYGFDYKVAYEYGSGADHQGYLNADTLRDWLGSSNGNVYFCGPRPFMQLLDELLASLGYPEERRHYEMFGPHLRFH